MNPFTTGVISIAIVLLLLSLGFPIGFAMIVVGFLGLTYLVSFTAAFHILSTIPYAVISNFDYQVIPLFLLTASFCLNAGFGRSLFRFAYSLVGRFPGGLAMGTTRRRQLR